MDAAPAIDSQDLAGHEGRVEEQVFYRAGDVLRAADALQRRLLGDAPLLGWREVLVAVGPEDRTGGDAVHTHVGTELERERAREPGETCLGHRIDHEVLER